MTCVTTRPADIRSGGSVIEVLVSPSQAYISSLPEEERKAVRPLKASLLIDTGASCTMIDPRIIDQLDIRPHSVTSISTPSSASHQVPVYAVNIGIPGIMFNLPDVPVVSNTLAPQQIDGLLGRDILSQCLFIYNGKNGDFTIALAL